MYIWSIGVNSLHRFGVWKLAVLKHMSLERVIYKFVDVFPADEFQAI